MGAPYAPGLLWVAELDEADETEQLAFLEAFAQRGLTKRFREVIGERVLELDVDDAGAVRSRWLDAEAARPIVEAVKPLGGSAPYGAFPECLQIQLYVPGADGEGEIDLADTAIHEWGYAPLEASLEALRGEIADGSLEDAELSRWLLGEIETCAAHGLVFAIAF
jgi:hypothetical protein